SPGDRWSCGLTLHGTGWVRAASPVDDAVAGVDCLRPTDRGSDVGGNLRCGQRVADLRVRPGLGEDDAADRPVLEDERTTAVATVDLRAELQDQPADAVAGVDVVAR